MLRSPVYAFAALLLAGVVYADPASEEGRQPSPGVSLPPLIVPDRLGVNIHFLQPRDGEMEMLAAAGTGQPLPGLHADPEGLKLTLTDAPQYLYFAQKTNNNPEA
jgi:hypothetical protein